VDVIGESRILHVAELSDLYRSPNMIRVTKSRRMRWAGYVVGMGDRIDVYRVWVGSSEGKRTLGRAGLR